MRHVALQLHWQLSGLPLLRQDAATVRLELSCPFVTYMLLQNLQSVDEDLLSEAAAQAPAAAWQKAAAAAATAAAAAVTSTQPGGGASSSREGSSSPRSQGVATAQHVRTLLHLGRKALRATVVAVELLRKQQQSTCSDPRSSPSSAGRLMPTAAMRFCAAAGDAGGGVAAEGSAVLGRFGPGAEVLSCRRRSLLIHLQVLLQEQVMCLGPWFEPWRFRPERTPLRLLTLQAAQVR